jgi:hypothetical protein
VEDLSVDGRIMLNWINLAQNRDRWWALVDMIMTLVVPKNGRNFLTEGPLASEEGLCSME